MEKAGERDRPTGAEAAPVRSKFSPHASAGPLAAPDRKKPHSSEAAKGFQTAAQETTEPQKPEPKSRKRRKSGSGGDQYQARNIVADFLDLCHDPFRDLPLWLRESRRKAGRPFALPQVTTIVEGNAYAAKTTTRVAKADGLRGQPLQELRRGLDADREGRGRTDDLLSRPRTGSPGYNQLRSVPSQGGDLGRENIAAGSEERVLSFKGLSAALHDFYGAKIEAVRRTLPASDRQAAVRTLLEDRDVALRVLADMRAASAAALKERRQIMRHSRHEAKGSRKSFKINSKIVL